MLECYYNINQQDDFEQLFGHTYIGQNPTPLRNSHFVLHLDFSPIKPTGTIEKIEQFAGLRWVIEFKYYSNTAFKKLKTSIADFALQPDDTQQIAGYVEGLSQEYPQARVSQFVIYCFGNQGFRVFEL